MPPEYRWETYKAEQSVELRDDLGIDAYPSAKPT